MLKDNSFLRSCVFGKGKKKNGTHYSKLMGHDSSLGLNLGEFHLYFL